MEEAVGTRKKKGEDRLDAWYDGSAICVIAVGSSGDPLDLSQHEVERFIEKLQACLEEVRAEDSK
jgi:hypothetical protein